MTASGDEISVGPLETIERKTTGKRVKVTADEARHFREVFDAEATVEHSDSLGMVNCHSCWRPLLGERTQAKRAAGLILFETRVQAVAGRVMDHSSNHAVPFCKECLKLVRFTHRPYCGPSGKIGNPA